MVMKIAWSSLYLQFSSFNFLMSGLFGDILCLRFFLSWAYLWLFINAVTGFPHFNEFFSENVFVLHIDVLLWSTVTLYVHSSKLIGIVRNERKIVLPEESLPLWRMLYRNGGLSELLYMQFVWPKFELVTLKKGYTIEEDDYCYIVLDGLASAEIKAQDKIQNLILGSGEVIHVKFLHLFRQAECEAFAQQTVRAACLTEMKVYRCRSKDIEAIARQPQTKQAYQGLLIFVLTRIAERAILQQDGNDSPGDERNPAFLELEAWEEPDPMVSGSGKALTKPLEHFYASLRKSYRPPWPIIRWIPGLRHAALPAPHHVPPKGPAIADDNDDKSTDELMDEEGTVGTTSELTPLLS